MMEETIGGQALIEGVMIRSSKRYVMCVRKPNKKIAIKKIPVKKLKYTNIPILRGIIRFGETLYYGIIGIIYSASEATGKEEKLSKSEIFFTLLFSVLMTILIFYLVPLVIASFIAKGILFNLIDGIVRIIIFFIYLIAISFMPDIKRVFQYHGAEHMAVHCYEDKKKLTIENIKRYPTAHPRCGTSFILIVLIVSIFLFSFIPVRSFLERFFYRILLLPLIAGVSYELLKLAGKYYKNPVLYPLILPGLLLQSITTKKPDDDMIEVAVKALKAAVKN